jgi:peptidoglycan hydrolase CwlO-like protein
MLSLTCSLPARNEEVHKIISLRTEVANTAEEERKVSSLQAQLKEASNKVSALQAQLAKVQAELDEERTKVERAWSKRECTIGSIA